MFKYLVALLLITSSLQLVDTSSDSTSDYFLTPPYPPTAFYLQYYNVQFRVRGLDYPTFTFEGLPSFLNATADGSVTGTPNVTGTFKIVVNYAAGSANGSETVVISVAASGINPVTAAISTQVVLEVVANALNSYVYSVGQAISIALSTQHATAPVTWSYKSLPDGLSGSNSGVISGKINDSGLYSFSASAGDARGNSAQSYFTLNVQPGTLIKTSNLIDVPDRSVSIVYNFSQVENQQIAADTAVTDALGVVSTKKSAVQTAQTAQAKTQLALNLATSQEATIESEVVNAQTVYNNAVIAASHDAAIVVQANNTLQLAETALTNADGVLAAAKVNLAAAQAAWNNASEALAKANAIETDAQNNLTAAQNAYNQANANVISAQNVYNAAFNTLQAANANLVLDQQALQQANANVTATQNAVQLAQENNDNAQTAVNVADAALTAAQQALSTANSQVAGIRSQSDDATTALGEAKFNDTQALNQLYVAQAAKAAADKATLIAYAQGASSDSILANKTTYIFQGCTNQVYPVISGTVAVSQLIADGAVLASGHVVTWGNCTQKTAKVQVGNVISYVGNILSDGSISAINVSVQSS